MNLAFTVSARREIYEIVSRYAAENRELGVRFVEELDRCLGLLAANPRLGQRVSGTCRRVRLRRFPYTVIYSPEPDGDVIQVRVIYHQRRHAGYWQDRVEEPEPRYRSVPAAA